MHTLSADCITYIQSAKDKDGLEIHSEHSNQHPNILFCACTSMCAFRTRIILADLIDLYVSTMYMAGNAATDCLYSRLCARRPESET